MKRRTTESTRWRAPLGVALAALATAGCGATTTQYLRPWARVETSPRQVLAPHAIEWGGESRIQVEVDGDWQTLPHGSLERGQFRTHPVGEALALEEFTFVDPARRDPVEDEREFGASGIFLYHPGRATPAYIPPSRCATPMFSDAAEVTCFGCGDVEPYLRLEPSRRRDAPCGTLRVDTFDDGVESSRAEPSPRPRSRRRSRDAFHPAPGSLPRRRRAEILFTSAPRRGGSSSESAGSPISRSAPILSA